MNNLNRWPYEKKVNPNIYSSLSFWPKISIVTPSYNQGQYIEETILSVLNQNYPNIEYIIIDGGSTDNTLAVIKKYESSISFWISEKDKGQTAAINKGLVKTTGDIINWINSDDIFLPKAFYTIATFFMDNKKIDYCYGNRILIDAFGNVTDYHFLPEYRITNSGYTVAQETMFWRRRLMNNIGLLDETLKFAMDFEYFLRFFKNGKGKKLPNFLGGFRIHDEHKSNNIMHIGYEEAYEIWNRFFPKLPHYYLKKQSFFSLLKHKFKIIFTGQYKMVLSKFKLIVFKTKSKI